MSVQPLPTPEPASDEMPASPRDLHTISLLVANKPGVLVRVALVFSRRGYNIESLVVSPSLKTPGSTYRVGDFSRMTITCSGDPETLVQIIRQLEKLVDVVQAIDHTGDAAIETEIALVKIEVSMSERTEILQVAEHFKAKVVDYGTESMILRVGGESVKVDAFLKLLHPYGIIEMVRSGKILMARGLEVT